MRCNNCGFVNKEEALRCERCNYPIKGSLNQEDIVPNQTPNPKDDDVNLNKTIPGKRIDADAWDTDNQSPLSDQQSEKDTDNSNSSHASENTVNPFKKTIDPSRQSTGITLKRIPREGEKEESINFNDAAIILNRDNCDPNNNTITSKEQALLEKENGEWFISNKSQLKTTYKKVKGKVKLQKGDVILLGNRAFEVVF